MFNSTCNQIKKCVNIFYERDFRNYIHTVWPYLSQSDAESHFSSIFFTILLAERVWNLKNLTFAFEICFIKEFQIIKNKKSLCKAGITLSI